MLWGIGRSRVQVLRFRGQALGFNVVFGFGVRASVQAAPVTSEKIVWKDERRR